MSAFTAPIVIRNGSATVLRRLALAASDARFPEAWLQDQLFLHPSALPIKELAPNVQELVPICKELNTLAGPADILFVTRSGQVVLVETKLWRNPEARREVIAQILDYAKELATWTYEDLSREVARATGKGPKYLLEAVKDGDSEFDEARFVDGINHNLRTGDVVLLIAGDGIRTGAEALVGFLERYGSLRFTFGLIEVAAFELGNGEILLQPRLLAKTEVVRRIVVVPIDRTGAELSIPVLETTASLQDADTGGEQVQLSEYQQWMVSFWAEYMRRLKLDDTRQPTPKNTPRSTNAFFPMPPSGGESWVSAYLARSSNRAGVYLTWSKVYANAAAAFDYLQADKDAIEDAIGVPLEWTANGTYSISAKSNLGEWTSPEDRENAMRFLLTTTNRFVNAFRPRLEAFLRSRSAS